MDLGEVPRGGVFQIGHLDDAMLTPPSTAAARRRTTFWRGACGPVGLGAALALGGCASSLPPERLAPAPARS